VVYYALPAPDSGHDQSRGERLRRPILAIMVSTE